MNLFSSIIESELSFRMMSMSDRLVLECPADYDDMADELDIDDPEGVEEIGVEQDVSGEESESGISDIAVLQPVVPNSGLVLVQEQQIDKETQEELEDLEQSLQVSYCVGKINC